MSTAIRTISREIASLRQTLKTMDRSLQRFGPILQKAMSRTGSAVPAKARRKLNLSAKRLTQLKLQGKYMATMRQLKPKQKAEVRSLLQKKGMPAAIARAQRLMSRIKAA